MRAKDAILAGALASMLTACIPSVYPYYTAADIVFESKLIGEWAEDGERWTFERDAEENAYELTVTDDEGNRGVLKAVLFELDGHRFLDLVAKNCDNVIEDIAEQHTEIIAASVFCGHLAVHLAAVEPQPKMAFFDMGWVADYLDEDPKALSHRIENDSMLLTGNTRELQRFLLKHVDDGKLFSAYSATPTPLSDK